MGLLSTGKMDFNRVLFWVCKEELIQVDRQLSEKLKNVFSVL